MIAICALFAIGIALSASPVVYQTIEKLEFGKVALVLVFLVVALTTAVTAAGWSDAHQIVTEVGTFPTGDLEWAVLLGALAYAGAGGTNNLVLSNWIRDKGYGMGKYAPRVVSPITGSEEAAAVRPGLRVRRPTRRTWPAGATGGARPTSSSSSRSS